MIPKLITCSCGAKYRAVYSVSKPRPHVCPPETWPKTDEARISELTHALQRMIDASFCGLIEAGGFSPFKDKGKVYITVTDNVFGAMNDSCTFAREALDRSGAKRDESQPKPEQPKLFGED